jgi:inorganic phosphate transporter, PiT family
MWGRTAYGGHHGFCGDRNLPVVIFEFINGFHDTANAVAIVIYTHSLPPIVAVIWNFFGVLLSAGTVADSVVAILPPSLVLNVPSDLSRRPSRR